MHSLAYEDLNAQDIPTCLGRLRVRSIGHGESIVLWSSLLMNGRMWMAQVHHFSKRYRVILIDPPGHGDSATLERAFTFADCAQCVVDVLDVMGVERTHFIGNSWGGMIGGTFAAVHPARVHAVVLMNCTASPAGWRHRLEFPLLARVIRLLGGFRGIMISVATRAFVGPTTERERPHVISHIQQALKTCDVESIAWAVESVVPRRPDQRPLFSAVRSPVLVVAGKEDRTFAVSETLAMARSIPGAEFVVIERTAHLAALENPDEVNALIDRFLKDVIGRELLVDATC
ncbi:alpha/beta fold hydrolase [Pseudomonas sp. CG7]|uniref:alpha/beta fold hydrolase n=1 Tax=Pseudomonas sp. CG7 TaxID=191007 RepID=UPI00203425C0|nr:alpha/beta fold hydrolase [Pseudomonas sp. CG7]MCM2459446.1 alpha/beta fold hydrolase [Pseudomonas sp. CG7]